MNEPGPTRALANGEAVKLRQAAALDIGTNRRILNALRFSPREVHSCLDVP